MSGNARTLAELEAGLKAVRRSPAEAGTVAAIVRRPEVETRERVEAATAGRGRGPRR